MAKNAVKAVSPLIGLNASTLNSPAYVKAGGGPTPAPAFMIRICNNSDKDVLMSFDGVNAMEAIRAETDLTLNFQTNAQPGNYFALLAAGTDFYFLGTAGGSGAITVSCYYQEQ